MNRSGMNKRLDDLVKRGLVHQKEVGAKAVVYWLTDDGEDQIMTA
jgi:predicted transcriptional regulator